MDGRTIDEDERWNDAGISTVYGPVSRKVIKCLLNDKILYSPGLVSVCFLLYRKN